jgi:hypothetical protein
VRNAFEPCWGGADVGVVAAPVRGSSLGDEVVVVETPLADVDGPEEVFVVDAESDPQPEKANAAIARTATMLRGVRTG